MGRPKVKVDWDEVGEMLKCGCDATAIATTLGISTDTLYTRSKSDNKLDFSAFSQQKRAEGDDLLRRKQFEIAMGGNIPMLIWLGKNRLGQTDKQAIDAKVERPNDPNRLMTIFRHSLRVFEVMKLQPEGIGFDPNNPEHRADWKNHVARAIEAQNTLYPDGSKDLEEWEPQFEKFAFREWIRR